MDTRLKNGLRPRPKIGLSTPAPDVPAAKLRVSPASRPSVMQAPVLVLNATFEPINVTAVRRALVLMLKGVAQAEETNPTKVHSTSEVDSDAVGDPAAELPAHSAAEPRALAQKYFASRPQYLPILQPRASGFRVDAGSRDAAFAGRAIVVGEFGGVLLRVQQPQRRPHSGRSRAAIAAAAASFHIAHFAAADALDRASRREVAEVSFLLDVFDSRRTAKKNALIALKLLGNKGTRDAK